MASANATIVLPGPANLSVQVEARAQGSVFLLDRTAPTPKLVQLDGWHESSHPWYWETATVHIEAELEGRVAGRARRRRVEDGVAGVERAEPHLLAADAQPGRLR